MRISVPIAQGRLASHFGHCEEFALMEVDDTGKTITSTRLVTAPPHEPGLLPGWLAEQGAQVIIAGSMGRRAQDLFAQHGIKVVVGAPVQEATPIVESYLAGTLETVENDCDH